MNRYRLRFTGRERNTVPFYPITLEVEAASQLDAVMKLYETHDRGPSDANGGHLDMEIELLGEVT